MKTKQLVFAGVCTAAGIVLPSIFHMIGASGTIFLPMHLPVLLCGLVCGYQLGGICGLIVPLLCSLLTGKPPLYPTGIAMMLELCTYGIVSGLMIKKTPLYPALITAMLAGRAVSGTVNLILLGMAGKTYTLSVFLAGSFVTALPGIIIQIIFIPLLLFILQKANILNRERTV